ncbi:MAG: hypothetical protein K9I85_13475 [Saprospiraceae bacterium]|nr:hypothetical protein [Saprospiraceae bacterium]
MTIRSLLAFASFLLLSLPASGQLRQILYTSVPGDSILTLQIDLQDSFSVHTWHNSAVFIESEIVLATCQDGIFKYVVEQGRYALKSVSKAPSLSISQAIPKRAGLTSQNGPCDETIHHRIFIPSDFVMENNRRWTRKESLNKSTINGR